MELSRRRKRVVLLAASVACMSGLGLLILPRHHIIAAFWIACMAGILVFAIAEFAKLKREEP